MAKVEAGNGNGSALGGIAAELADLVVKSAYQEAGKEQRILLIGPPKHGKTAAAFTLSKHAPESWPAQQFANLSDGFACFWDPKGHDTCVSLNCDIPMLDLSKIQEYGLAKKAHRRSIEILRERVRTGETTFAVVDSISEYADRMVRGLSALHPDQKEMWVPLQSEMDGFFSDYLSLPIDIAFICHVKDKGEDKKGKRWAASLPGGAQIEVDLMGKAAGIARRRTSMILPVVKTQIGKNTQPEYAIYPNGVDGVEGGTRYGSILADKEPANLRKILDKIRLHKERNLKQSMQ